MAMRGGGGTTSLDSNQTKDVRVLLDLKAISQGFREGKTCLRGVERGNRDVGEGDRDVGSIKGGPRCRRESLEAEFKRGNRNIGRRG